MAKKDKKYYNETLQDIEDRGKRLEALINLSNDIRDKERRNPIPFNDFLYFAAKQPKLIFRNIFQLFHDMVNYYVPQGKDEYEKGTNSIGFVDYNSSELFVKDCEDPFFADRLFANRFMNLTRGFRKGIQGNRIYLFEGPPGSGKSTFLNNLLYKLEAYTKTPEGAMYKTYWRIEIEKVGSFQRFKEKIDHDHEKISDNAITQETNNKINQKKYLDIACPNNDHPVLMIPKNFRKNFLEELIYDKSFKKKLFHTKEYDWVLKDSPCSICSSIYNALLDEVGSPIEVFNMINARQAEFSRQFGKGISIYNPGDARVVQPISNETLQNLINELLKTDDIKYIYSDFANTNNGVLALMDVKENNIDRLKYLHGIISDGVHKVEFIEEKIKTLFVGIVNPEDKVHYENIKSFKDRIITVNIPYILDYNTEVKIYKNKFGDKIESSFLPGVLENFAKIIISSRMEKESAGIKKWVSDPFKYSKYLDKNAIILKMDVYTGKIPSWLSEEDLNKFDRETRKEIIAESEIEGKKGISGRQSLNVFNTFFGSYSKKYKLITMRMVKEFFIEENGELNKEIPDGFIDSLQEMYDYNVLQEVKESIYYYNEKQISGDIKNYLYSLSFEIGDKIKCEYTGDLIDVTEDFYSNFEAIFMGTTSAMDARKAFRKENQHEYISRTLSQEIKIQGKNIEETEQYENLFNKYTRNLKENALAPYYNNDNFRRAIIDFKAPAFEKYDKRLKRDVTLLQTILVKKFKYTPEGAKEISLYVLDNNIDKKF